MALWCQILWQAPASGETLAQQHNLKGVSYLRDRNLKEAKKEFMLAIKADTEYAPAHNNLGYLLYNEAVTKSGEDASPPVQINLEKGISSGASLVKEALYHLETALKLTVQPNIIRQAKENLALLYTDTRISLPVRQDDWHKKGIKIYESLIHEEPNNPEYHMRLGFAYFNTANPGGGFGKLDKASELVKGQDTLWIHKELKRFYLQINFIAKAVKEQEIIDRFEHE